MTSKTDSTGSIDTSLSYCAPCSFDASFWLLANIVEIIFKNGFLRLLNNKTTLFVLDTSCVI